MRLGVFGGTFNPIHYGHLRAAEEVREERALDKVLFIPAGVPPLKSSELAPAEDRFMMTSLAVGSHMAFEALDIELRRPEKSYTVQTIEELGRLYPGAELSFIIGIDAFLDLPAWREPGRLAQMVDFVVISRPPHMFSGLGGSPYLEADPERLKEMDGPGGPASVTLESAGGRRAHLMRITPFDVSSSLIRDLVRRGRSIKYLLPENVESFIITNGLFAG